MSASNPFVRPRPANSNPLVAEPWVYRDPTAMTPRHWLLGTLLMLGELIVLGSTGGVGKTSLAIACALACITGRKDIMGLHVFQRVKVWFLTLEDDRDELERRIAAAMIAHNIKPDEIKDRLFVNSARERPLLLAEADGNGTFIACPDADALEQEIKVKSIGLTIIDPLIKAHRSIENNNQHMDKLAGLITDIGYRTNSAMLVPCHFRKGGKDDSRDAFRGGSALVDAARIARTILTMDDEQAKAFNIKPDDAAEYVRLTDAKQNMAPRSGQKWFHLCGIPLGNTDVDPNYPAGDTVQAVRAWEPPSAFEGLSLQVIADIFDKIRKGPEPGEFYLRARQSQDWVGKPIMQGGVSASQAATVAGKWCDNDVLRDHPYNSPKREQTAGLILNDLKAAEILAPMAQAGTP